MTNRLAKSSSPYLLQHADNPVDWYEWGDEAFAEARRRDVPVLLSVGYSACHWCHVMAHESFEDRATAQLMNDRFVNVKVDREERPDVDSVYMDATQAMTGHGGWPMTVWLDHEGAPFYAGTYFPDQARHGMPSFTQVLTAVSEAWTDRRHEVREQALRLVDAIDRRLPPGDIAHDEATVRRSVQRILTNADRVRGGFGRAPKFPQSPVLELLMRVHDRPWAGEAREVLTSTLVAMARGGIYDQIGGGFARYSVDERWLVPHFEKMLYDNAQLARVYLWTGLATGSPALQSIAEETLDYLRQDLGLPEGGFASAEDADSEGEEGKYYVWTPRQLAEILGEEDAAVASEVWGVTPEGNFEGASILHVARTIAEVADARSMDAADVADVMDRSRLALKEARSRRVRPGRDDKVVAAWNGLAIRAFAEAGAAWDRPDLIAAAVACAEFVTGPMRTSDGRLLRTWTNGVAGPPGFLDDHAAVAVGLWALYAATGDVRWYRTASELTSMIPARFTDPAGGFFTTADDAEALVKRPKDQMDNPLPSGNSLAAEALVLSSAYTGDTTHRDLAEQTIAAGGSLVEQHPDAAARLVSVVDMLAEGMQELAVTGPEPEPLTEVYWRRFRPSIVLAVGTGAAGPESELPLLAGRRSDSQTRAFLCRNFACRAPVETPDELGAVLDSAG